MSRKFVAIVIFASTLCIETNCLAADPDHGKLLAERWCMACHVVEPGQKAGTTEAPPFIEIAKQPGFDSAKLAFFLLDPHPKMPDLGLTRSAAADLAAYIISQR